MICIVDTPVDLANFVELNNLLNNRKGRNKGQLSVSVLSWAKFGKMAADEKLYLLAHGSPTQVGTHVQYTPQALAAELLKRGLPKIAKIVLVACETGVSKNGNPAYCTALANQIDQQSKGAVKVPVTGFTDSAVTDQFGKTRAVDPVAEGKLGVQYADIMNRWSKDLDSWENTAAHLPWGTEQDLVDGARIMALKSKDFFAELYSINGG